MSPVTVPSSKALFQQAIVPAPPSARRETQDEKRRKPVHLRRFSRSSPPFK